RRRHTILVSDWSSDVCSSDLEQYHLVTAQREVRHTLERISAAGARVAYFPVNITDAKATADLLQQVRAKFGPVTALVHGAGVLRSEERRVGKEGRYRWGAREQ